MNITTRFQNITIKDCSLGTPVPRSGLQRDHARGVEGNRRLIHVRARTTQRTCGEQPVQELW
jgi:hypothetical protein